nr:NotI family restriction endonuclease [uncultured Corynebacterium sp.]
MAGQIAEFFGFKAEDKSQRAYDAALKSRCPFLHDDCIKTIALPDGRRVSSGACAIRQKSHPEKPIICCPIRLYFDDYAMLDEVASLAFKKSLPKFAGRAARDESLKRGIETVAVFGHRWGGELRLPKRNGEGNYYVDWILVHIDAKGEPVDFCAIEVQTIDTTGNYKDSFIGLSSAERENRWTSAGLNWENVSKRILPQLIYKGSILGREKFCSSGMFFVTPRPVYDRVMRRLGGESNVATVGRLQPSSITFLAYDVDTSSVKPGEIADLKRVETNLSTVAEVRDAFNRAKLPEPNVYGDAIELVLGAKFSTGAELVQGFPNAKKINSTSECELGN